MTTNDLHDLLEQACDHLPETDLAERAWAAAYGHEVRRRRMLVGLVSAAAVATIATVVATDWAPTDRGHAASNSPSHNSPTSPTPTMSSTSPPPSALDAELLKGVWTLPDPSDMGGLPWAQSGPVHGEVNLYKSARQFSLSGGFRAGERIDAAFAVPPTRAVGILTSLGNVYLLDQLALGDTADPHGNASFHLSPSAIAPDGTMMAIAQPGGVVLIETTRTGAAKPWRTIAIKDANVESSNFVDDGRTILAGSDGGLYVIDVASGTTIKRHSTFGADAILLAGGAGSGTPVQVRLWDTAAQAYGPVVEVPDPRIGEVWGIGGSNLPGSEYAAGLVSPTRRTLDALWRARGLNAYQGIAAVPLRGGEASLLLDVSIPATDDSSMSHSRSKGGIRPVAFTGSGELLVVVDGGYAKGADGEFHLVRQDLVSWHVRTGELARVAALTGEWVDLIIRPGA